jgi:hypothetical protein
MADQKSWRDVIKVHPAADKWPLMPEAELRALGEDIKANGMQVPVVLWREPNGMSDFVLLDGRNRLDAMEFVGMEAAEPRTKGDKFWHLKPSTVKTTFARSDPWEFTISANAHRRHLTAEQKRDLIAELLKAKPERNNVQTAKIVGVSDKTVAAVRRDLEGRSEIPIVSTRTDTAGRAQPVVRLVRSAPVAIEPPERRTIRVADAVDVTPPVRTIRVGPMENVPMRPIPHFEGEPVEPIASPYDFNTAGPQAVEPQPTFLESGEAYRNAWEENADARARILAEVKERIVLGEEYPGGFQGWCARFAPHLRFEPEPEPLPPAPARNAPGKRQPAPPLAEQGAAVLKAFDGWLVEAIRPRGEAILALPMNDRAEAVIKLATALCVPLGKITEKWRRVD